MVENTITNNEGKLTKVGLRNMGDRMDYVIKKIFGMTVHQFAKLCEMSPSTLYGWCNGNKPKNKEAFIRLINTFHLNKDWLFYGEGSIFDKRGKPYFKK
jgi:transcriptional regulator with XRE-family HTH domain